jgi:hypothetical protein
MPFDHVKGDMYVCGIRHFEFHLHQHSKERFTTYLLRSVMEIWALFVAGVCSASAVEVSLLH